MTLLVRLLEDPEGLLGASLRTDVGVTVGSNDVAGGDDTAEGRDAVGGRVAVGGNVAVEGGVMRDGGAVEGETASESTGGVTVDDVAEGRAAM